MYSVEDIWKDYHKKLYVFIKNRVNDPADANDIINDVFLKIYAGLNNLKAQTKLKSWIYKITRNSIIDFYRSQKSIKLTDDNLPDIMDNSSENISMELANCLRPMIQQLPEHYREAIELSELEGLTQSEVARTQNISLSGAKSRVQRGRALLKKMLTDCCNFEFDAHQQVIDYEPKSRP